MFNFNVEFTKLMNLIDKFLFIKTFFQVMLVLLFPLNKNKYFCNQNEIKSDLFKRSV